MYIKLNYNLNELNLYSLQLQTELIWNNNKLLIIKDVSWLQINKNIKLAAFFFVVFFVVCIIYNFNIIFNILDIMKHKSEHVIIKINWLIFYREENFKGKIKTLNIK